MLDNLSTQAALNTLGVFHEIRKELNPTLHMLGIVPTFVSNADKLNKRETEALAHFKSELPNYWKSVPKSLLQNSPG